MIDQTTSTQELLRDGFTRVRDSVERTAKGLTLEESTFRVEARANSIGWLLWHLTRVQDDHIAAVAGTDQVWRSGGWVERFSLPFAPDATGYSQAPDEIAGVRVEADLLRDYHQAVYEQTMKYLERVDETELARVVDSNFDPPVTASVRLVSVLTDDLMHAGQAAFVLGIVRPLVAG